MATSFFRPAMLVVGSFLLAAPAIAQDGYSWHINQYDDAETGQRTSRLVYGVPETDDVQFAASCTTGMPGSVVALGGPTGDLAKGDEATVQFIGRRFSQQMAGSVLRPDSEEGIFGVEVAVAHNDTLWQALSRQREVLYTINGSKAVPLPLRGSARPIRDYLRFCRQLAQVGAQSASSSPETPASDPRWDTCSAFGNIRSVQSDTPVTVKFVNRTDSYRAVMWINFEGTPVEYATLNPGQTSTVNTYVTHPWMFTDGPGNCIEMFMPQPGIPLFQITAPNRDFGPE